MEGAGVGGGGGRGGEWPGYAAYHLLSHEDQEAVDYIVSSLASLTYTGRVCLPGRIYVHIYKQIHRHISVRWIYV